MPVSDALLDSRAMPGAGHQQQATAYICSNMTMAVTMSAGPRVACSFVVVCPACGTLTLRTGMIRAAASPAGTPSEGTTMSAARRWRVAARRRRGRGRGLVPCKERPANTTRTSVSSFTRDSACASAGVATASSCSLTSTARAGALPLHTRRLQNVGCDLFDTGVQPGVAACAAARKTAHALEDGEKPCWHREW